MTLTQKLEELERLCDKDDASRKLLPVMLSASTAEELIATIKKMREALEFYAEPYTWARVGADARHMGAVGDFNFNHMYGETARACLKELEGG